MEYREWKMKIESERVRELDRIANNGLIDIEDCPRLNAEETVAVFKNMIGRKS